MFHNQSENLDLTTKKYLAVYQSWCQENNKKERAGHYLDGEFFQWCVVHHKQTNKLSDELCELLDLLVRKNITHKNFIRYEDEVKHEMYSNAMSKIFQYTIRGYDESKGTAFVFFTSAIRNAFKEVLKDYYASKNLAAHLLKTRNIDLFVHNYEVADICDFDDTVTDALKFMNDDDKDEVKFEMNSFYKEIAETWNFDKIRLIEDDNAPKFKRQYYTFNCFIPVHDFCDEKFGLNLYTNVNKKDFISFAARMGVESDETKDIEILKKRFIAALTKRAKGIIVDYFDLSLINESNGIPPSYIQNRAMMVRKLGHQYIGVFSDEWNFKDEDSGKEIGKIQIKKRIQNLFDMMLAEYPVATGRFVRHSYIPLDQLDESNMHPKVWYALSDKRDIRNLSPDQTPAAYLNWLNYEKNPTRVYDACMMIS